jgi:O-antigen/teichoic acid export membrane protein
MKSRFPDFAIIGVFLLLSLGFFFPQTLGGRTLIPAENLFQYEPYYTDKDVVGAPEVPHNHLVSDLILQNYQWKSFLREQLTHGEVPLWNPYQFGGIPFLAAGQHSGLYPLSILYYVLDLWAAYGWFTVLNLWLAGVFMYGFVRSLNVGRGGAMLAGIVYQLCGFVLASVVFQMMIGGLPWLPLMLWMIERHIRQERAYFSLVVGAIALGLNVLAGHAEITIYTLLLSGYYAGLRLIVWGWQSRHENHIVLRVIGKGILMLLMVGLGLGLGSVQLIPLFEFVQTNWRADRASLDTVLSYAHPLRDLLQFLMPNFYGSPAHHTITNVFTNETITLNGVPAFHTEWGMKNYVEAALYVGILPLLLSVVALFPTKNTHNPQAPRWIFAVLGVLSLTFMFGLPTYALIYALPGINQLNSPFRWIFALTVCVAVLAGIGFDRVLKAENLKVTRVLSIGVFVSGITVLIGLLASRLFYPQVAGVVERVFNSMAKATDAFPNAELFYSYQVVNVAIFGIMLILSGVVLLWALRHENTPASGFFQHFRKVEVLAVVIVSADLMIASWGFNPASDPTLLDYTPPVVQWMQTQEGDFRYISLDDPSQRPILNANSTWRYGLEDMRGYDSIIPRDTMNALNELAPQVQRDFNRAAPLYTVYPESVAFEVQTALDDPLLRYYNVRYIVTHNSTTPQGDFTQVYQDNAVTVWQVNDTFARVVVCCEVNADWRAVLASSAFIPPQRFTEFTNALIPQAQSSYWQDSGREKFIDVSIPQDNTWVMFSENYHEGWRAFVRPVGTSEASESNFPVRRVNGNFVGVQLPEGDWTVRLVYSPASFQVGVFGSVMSVIVLTLALGMSVWQSFVGGNTEQTSTTARVARNSIAPILLNLFNRGIDFAFLIVMLRLLTPQEVGTYYYIVVVFVWFDIFTNFGLDLYLIREVSRDKSKAGQLFYTTSMLRLFLCVVGIGLVLGFIAIRQATVTPALDAQALLTLALLYMGLFPASLSKGMSSLFYAYEQAEKPSAIATITTINKTIFGAIVLLLGWGIVGLALVSVFNNVLTLAVLLYFGRTLIGKITTWKPDTARMLEMVRGSWSLLLNHFLATIFFQIDIIILEALKGAEIVAKYSVGYRWIMAINVIPSFFTQALFPLMSRQAQDDREALVRSYTFGIKVMVMLSVPTAVVFTLLSVPLTNLMGGAQYLPEGAIALLIMVWSIPIGWMNSLTQYTLVALDLHRRITIAFVCAVAFNIGMNALLIPQYSYVAAGITTIASELVLFLCFARMLEKQRDIKIEWFNLLWRAYVAGAAMLAIGWMFNGMIGLVVGGAVYAVVLIALQPFSIEERAMFGRIIPKRLLPVMQRLRLASG